MRYKRGVIAAMRSYKAARPWSGDEFERWQKLLMLHDQLCQLHNASVQLLPATPAQTREMMRLVRRERGRGFRIAGTYRRDARTILMHDLPPSVTTYLHEFAHALDHAQGTLDARYARGGRAEVERFAITWSMTLFARVFPDEFLRNQIKQQLRISG